jgi:hypothetical protein
MHPAKRHMLIINVLGGIAVLGSYAHWLSNNPATRGQLWGGIPEAMLPFYTVSMLSAAAGYLAFTYHLLFRVDPETARIGSRFRFPVFNTLYVVVLVPSALWMPLTFAMLEQPSSGLWLSIRMVLAAVGFGSIGIVAALSSLRPRRSKVSHWIAAAGSIAFSIQTALLDALIWPAYFPV